MQRMAVQKFFRLFTDGFNTDGTITLTISFSEPVSSFAFDLYHVNGAGPNGDSYTLSATTTTSATIYPTFTSSSNPSYTTNGSGYVNSFNNSTSGDRAQVGVNFSNSDGINSITLLWDDCSACTKGAVHGSGLGNIEFCPVPVDTDGDGVVDTADKDDDNDGILDEIESCGSMGSLVNEDITVEIMLDNYPGETDWTLKDEQGNTVLSGGSYGGADANSLQTATLADANGDYTFRITDSWGDGICCSYGTGYYEIKVEGVTVIGGSSSGSGQFGSETTESVSAGSSTSFSCIGGDPGADSDGDGTLNQEDSDFCTLNANGVCTEIDTDGDGIIDQLDEDSDGDGIPDAVEGGGSFTNGDLDANDVLDYENLSPPGVDANGIPIIAGSLGQGVGTSQDGGSLPIELGSFFIMVKKGQGILIKWETLSETNNDFFSLEKSKDAKEWEVFHTQSGAGTTQEVHKYRHTDLNPYRGTSYYRLKQTDFNGDYSYSNVIDITFDGGFARSLQFYPNPTAEYLTLEGSPDELESYKFYDIQGREVTDRITLVEQGNFHARLDLSLLDKGVYILETSNGSHKIRKK